jgi:hypothetical protein
MREGGTAGVQVSGGGASATKTRGWEGRAGDVTQGCESCEKRSGKGRPAAHALFVPSFLYLAIATRAQAGRLLSRRLGLAVGCGGKTAVRSYKTATCAAGDKLWHREVRSCSRSCALNSLGIRAAVHPLASL